MDLQKKNNSNILDNTDSVLENKEDTKVKISDKKWVCYLLKSQVSNRTYIGATNDFKNRIRRHNGIIKGGAKYTQTNRPWEPVCIVSGFPDKIHALCFEWRVKRKRVKNRFKTVYYLDNRVKNIYNVLLNQDKFSNKCLNTQDMNITITFINYDVDIVKSLNNFFDIKNTYNKNITIKYNGNNI